MSCYVPTCTIPTCVPTCPPASSSPICYPVGGVGSLSSSSSIRSGGGTAASSLGIAPGATVSCINQTPPSEIVIQPAPVLVTIPGPILSASCEPVRVGGYTACAGSSGRSSRSMMSGSRPYICRS